MGSIQEKPIGETKAISTAQPRLTVQGPDGQVRIAQGVIAPARVDGRRKAAPIKLKFATDDMLMIGQMHQATERMFKVMARLPPVVRTRLRSQLGAITSSGTEKCDDPPPPPGPAITTLDIMLMEAAYEALAVQVRGDEAGARLVAGRAVGTDWKPLVAADGRSLAMCKYARNNCLYRMARSDQGQRALDVLAKIALATLARMGA